jgi:hypothetical protein
MPRRIYGVQCNTCAEESHNSSTNMNVILAKHKGSFVLSLIERVFKKRNEKNNSTTEINRSVENDFLSIVSLLFQVLRQKYLSDKSYIYSCAHSCFESHETIE